jgi:hypothetical protein
MPSDVEILLIILILPMIFFVKRMPQARIRSTITIRSRKKRRADG